MTRCPWACYLSCSQCVHQCERWVESEKKWLYACVCEWHMLYEVLRVLKQRKTAQRRIGPFTPINGCAENYFVKGGIMALRWDTARFCYSTSQTLKKTKSFFVLCFLPTVQTAQLPAGLQKKGMISSWKPEHEETVSVLGHWPRNLSVFCTFDPFLVFLGKVQVLVFTVSMEFSPGYVPS